MNDFDFERHLGQLVRDLCIIFLSLAKLFKALSSLTLPRSISPLEVMIYKFQALSDKYYYFVELLLFSLKILLQN